MDCRTLAVLILWLVSIHSVGLLCILGALLGVTRITGLTGGGLSVTRRPPILLWIGACGWGITA